MLTDLLRAVETLDKLGIPGPYEALLASGRYYAYLRAAEDGGYPIARHLKDTRDRCFVAKNANGQTVNRNPGMAVIGGCTDTNEFNFLQWKFISALGVPYRDSQARV